MTAHLIERFFLCAVCACEKNEEFMARKIFSFFYCLKKITQQWLTIWLRASKKATKSHFYLLTEFIFSHMGSQLKIYIFIKIYLLCVTANKSKYFNWQWVREGEGEYKMKAMSEVQKLCYFINCNSPFPSTKNVSLFARLSSRNSWAMAGRKSCAVVSRMSLSTLKKTSNNNVSLSLSPSSFTHSFNCHFIESSQLKTKTTWQWGRERDTYCF